MSSLKRIAIDYTIEMLSNFHIGSGAGVAGLADRTVLRAANKELIIPGSTIKGRARHHCEQLCRSLGLYICGGRAVDSELCKDGQPPCLICRLFGSEWMPNTLRFSDAQLTDFLRNIVRGQHDGGGEFDYQTISCTRTRLNRILRRVEEGALFTFEEGTEGLVFEGRISGSLLSTDMEVMGLPLELLALLVSLSLIDRFGGKKTIGLGECAITINSVAVERQVSPVALQDVIKNHLEELVLYDEYRTE
jgi:CRISPR/Cas system CSM-associated protein Csm3 (group 7 of RAMP superfamily)